MIEVVPVRGLPEITEGDDLVALIADAIRLRDGDVVTIASKVVAKSEGAVVALGPAADPAEERRRLAGATAVDVVADTPSVLIVRTVHGLVCANAGIDASNAADGTLVLLPADPDASARRLREGLRRATGADVGVVVTDTFGRPWREGQTDVAVGVAGLAAVRDERGTFDRSGRPLTVTEVAVADELAAAADLARGKSDGIPVVVVRGFAWESDPTAGAADLMRDPATDLFPRARGMLARALTDKRWPETWAAAPSDQELAAVRAVAPAAVVTAHGPPTVLTTPDAVEAGLAVAVLADCGMTVRWRRDATGVTIEAGRPGAAR